MSIEIRTNNVPRELTCFADLTVKEQEEFDYIKGDEVFDYRLVRYKGQVYDVNEFEALGRSNTAQLLEDMKGWDGYQSDSYFSGVVVKYAGDHESVVMGTYFS